MVTHDVQEAVLLADRIVVMRAAASLAHDTPRALMSHASDPEVAALIGDAQASGRAHCGLMQRSDGEATHG